METNHFDDNSTSRVHVQGNLEHSTDHRASQNDHLKEVYQFPQSDWSKEVSQRIFPELDSYPEVYVAPNQPQLVDRESHPEALADQHPYTGPVDENRARDPKLKQYKWLILVAAIIIIGAVVGGALGGILGKRDKNGQGTVNTSRTSWSVLNISNLAATNWTDSDGNRFHAVLWQSTSNHLIVSTFNGSSSNWTATNISSMVSATALPGTPMAAVVRGLQFSSFGPFGIVLFYITPNNTLADLYSPDLAATIWQIGNFTQSGELGQAAFGSQLAARWDLCGLHSCTGNVWLAYEDEEHSLRVAGSNGWGVSPGTLATSITPSSAIAMTATNRIQPTSFDSWDGASSARLYFEESQTLQQWGLDDGSGSWYNTGAQIVELPEVPPRIAAIAFENATELSLGPIDIILAIIYSDNVILTNFYNNQTWFGNEAPNIQNTTYSAFTAGAMIDGSNIKFYGLATDGTIQSFTADRENPRNWMYDPNGPLPVLGLQTEAEEDVPSKKRIT